MAYSGHRGISRYDGSTAGAWENIICGHCGRPVGAAVIARAEDGTVAWLWCPACGGGSVRGAEGVIHPTTKAGPAVEGLPDEVAAAYEEARASHGVGAYTASELLCRKLLMHVAVDKGAQEGLSFVEYLNHLETAGYITPPMRPWVNLIRQHGNEATHLLAAPGRERATGTLLFTAELLRLTYEMGHLADRFVQTRDLPG